MHYFKKLPLIAVIASFLLVGCQSAGEKETVATVVGGVAGGVIGYQFGHGSGRVVGAAIGSIIGGLLGNAVGKKMDAHDQTQATNAFHEATRVPIGQTVYWNNDRTGHWGSYRPVRDGMSDQGYYCREFVSTVNVGGSTERIYRTACRHPNGTWQAI